MMEVDESVLPSNIGVMSGQTSDVIVSSDSLKMTGFVPDMSLGSSVLESDNVPLHNDVWDNDWSLIPRCLCMGNCEFMAENHENFFKGCKWAPDGTCLLTNSDDNCLHVFKLPQEICDLSLNDVPELQSLFHVREAELIYDYCWYPLMNPSDPAKCCFLSTSRDAPVHMWDVFTGQLVSTYRPHDHMDELLAAHSITLNPDGTKLYCGFNKLIKVFDINRPGKECVNRPTLVDLNAKTGKQQKKQAKSAKVGQHGIISCIDVNTQQPNMYAAGSYSRSIGLYCEPDGQMYCMFQGQVGGVTHVKFSPDGNRLYSGGRKDREIICWDVRNPGKILFILERNISTNQRIYFDIDHTGRYIISGCQDGTVLLWDTLSSPTVVKDGTDPIIPPSITYTAHQDCVNGISIHPTMPVLATTSGQRQFILPSLTDSESESDDANKVSGPESNVKLWWVGKKLWDQLFQSLQ